MSFTPGTPEWLRVLATRSEYKAISEGLIRAANRIERLANSYKAVRSGQDNVWRQTELARHTTQIQTMAGPPAYVKKQPALPVFRIDFPESMTGDLSDWVNGSANMGIGFLDPAKLTLENDPDKNGCEETEAYRLKDFELLLDKESGQVTLEGPAQNLEVEKAVALKWVLGSDLKRETSILEIIARIIEPK